MPSTLTDTPGLGLPYMPPDPAIRQVFALYHPGGCHSHQVWRKKMSCGILKSLFEASFQKARNEPFTQLIKATRCIVRLNTTIKAEELSNFSSNQMLTTDKNR